MDLGEKYMLHLMAMLEAVLVGREFSQSLTSLMFFAPEIWRSTREASFVAERYQLPDPVRGSR